MVEPSRQVAEVTPKYRKMTEEKDDLASAKAYWTERRDPLAVRAARLKNRIDSLEERRKKVARVGVWTDDYSNLFRILK